MDLAKLWHGDDSPAGILRREQVRSSWPALGRALDRLNPFNDELNPPDGWFVFGSHVGFSGPIEFSDRLAEDGLPLWERHPEP